MAKLLARRGAEVVVHARSRSKAERVCDEIVAETGAKRPEILLADLASFDAIDAAIESYVESGRPLHLLVNNAGLVSLGRRTNEAGLELGFAVNYLAHFRLSLGLLDTLRGSGSARIVNIGSDSYRVGRLEFDDLMLEKRYSMTRSYAQSKLAVLYSTIELASRLRAAEIDVSVNAVDPGPVASNIGADNPGVAYRLIGPVIRRLFPSAERAARTALWVATDPALDGQSGGYYRSLRHRKNPLDFDPAISRRLWEESLRLNGLSDPLFSEP